MNIKNIISDGEHESVHFYSDTHSKLEAVVAIHTTYSGVSLGGCRINSFSSQEEAVKDVLRLSKHMTYKALLANLDIGGGKAVIITKPGQKKTPELLKSFAFFLNSLGGRYIVSVDLGSSTEDMELIRKSSNHVIGYSLQDYGAGDPGIYTARGVLVAMKVAAEHRWSNPSLKGRKVIVVGIGDVGYPLCMHLLAEGAQLSISDINPKRIQSIKELNPSVQVLAPEKVHQTPCDILAPCALGGFFNEKTVHELQCKIVAGAANNQCANDDIGKQLYKRGIIYLPDFAINSGGLIGVVTRGLRKKNLEETNKKIDQIASTVQFILTRSLKRNIPHSELALELAKERYSKVYYRTIV